MMIAAPKSNASNVNQGGRPNTAHFCILIKPFVAVGSEAAHTKLTITSFAPEKIK
jgi:hypothetical protein